MKKIKCKYCTKVIEGHTDGQIEHLLQQHILSKHKDKIEVREIK
jgi:hypothetical protein